VPSDAYDRGTVLPIRPQIWEERCWKLEDGEELWAVRDGMLIVRGEPHFLLMPGAGAVAYSELVRRDVLLPGEAPLRGALRQAAVVPSGVHRSGHDLERRDLLIVRTGSTASGRAWTSTNRLDMVAWRLLTWRDEDPDKLAEFEAILDKLGVCEKVSFAVYEDPRREDVPPARRRDYGAVLFDGTNVGLLSDGTLRVAEIVQRLLGPAGSTILIEEPETAVHPGLLERLLSVIDAYSLDRQIVLSTHSPIVVSACLPEEIRLVERSSDRTTVRAIEDAEVLRVHEYLRDTGSLGEYVYQYSRD
jgi:hypothetical protein